MIQPIPTPSEEEHRTSQPPWTGAIMTRVQGRIRLLTPNGIAAYLAQYIDDPSQEWFLALFLDPEQYLIARDPWVLYQGHQCPVHAHVNFPEFFQHARSQGAHTLLTARFHAHKLPRWDEHDYRHFDEFRLMAKDAGVRLRNHLTLDCTGAIVSWRDGLQSAGVSGTSVCMASAMRLWYSAAITPVIIGCMGLT